jgi:soluble lytic murein transglycosylase
MSAARRKDTAGVTRLGRLFLIVAVLLVIAVVIGVSRFDIGGTIDELTLPLRHDDIIRQQAREKGVPADLIAAVIYEESKFEDQTSSAGARGLMQITPDTADTIETLSGGETFVYDDLADPDLNIRYGTFYLAYLLDKYDGDVVAALAAYNAGEGNADAWGGAKMKIDDIEFPETYDYVKDVLERREQYRDKSAEELGL